MFADSFSAVSASSEVFSHSANLVASYEVLGALEARRWTSRPSCRQLASPASHCGDGATDQLPAVSGAPDEIELAPHTAEFQVQTSPEL